MSTDEEYLDNLLKAFEEEEKIREKENPVIQNETVISDIEEENVSIPEMSISEKNIPEEIAGDFNNMPETMEIPEAEAMPEVQDSIEDDPEIYDESFLESAFAENMIMDSALLESALAGTASLDDALMESPVAANAFSEENSSEETFEEEISSVEALLENALLDNDAIEDSPSKDTYTEAVNSNDAFLQDFFAETASLNEAEQAGLGDDLSAFFAESAAEANNEEKASGVDEFAEIERLLQMAESQETSSNEEGQDEAIQELTEAPKEKKKKKKRGLPWKKKAKAEDETNNEVTESSEGVDIVPEESAAEKKEQEDASIDEFAFAAGFFDSATESLDILELEPETKTGKKAKKEKKKKEKGKKEGGGFFGKLLEALAEDDEEEGAVNPEGEALEEDEILKQLEAEEKAKKAKKPKKEKKRKNKKKGGEGENPDDLDLDAEGDEESGKGKKKKKKKEKKVKEKPEGGEIVKEKGKKVLSRKSFLTLIAFCASLIAAIVCLSAFLPDYVEKKQAREAFYAGDYEEAYVLLYGKNLNAGDALIFGRVSCVLKLERKTESYYFHQEEGKQAEALNALLEGVKMYQEMIQGDVFGSEEELQSGYKKILDILNQQYAVDEAYALEIISYSDLRYSEKVYAIVDGTDGIEEEAPAGPEDILPEEEAIIQTESGNEGA